MIRGWIWWFLPASWFSAGGWRTRFIARCYSEAFGRALRKADRK